MPLFSVITVTFNDFRGLNKTKKSLFSQNFNDFEWIVVDGGSGSIIYTVFNDIVNSERHTLISERDSGIFDAMNKGVSRSTGDYVIFMNGGDIFADDNVLSDISKLTSYGFGLIYGDCFLGYLDGSMKYKAAKNHSFIWYGMFANHQAIFYLREYLIKLKYKSNLRVAGDYWLTAEYLQLINHHCKVKRAISVFDMCGVSNSNELIGRKENWMVQKEVLNVPIVIRILIRFSYVLSSAFRRILRSKID
jgi:putative colanic acid biosynthesis glycosyltransferase